jgi:hypothetical protein
VYAAGWGDGSQPTLEIKPFTSSTDTTAVTVTHTYTRAGTYTDQLAVLSGGAIELYRGNVIVARTGTRATQMFAVPRPPPAGPFPSTGPPPRAFTDTFRGVRVRSHKLKVKRGHVTVLLNCPASTLGSCAGTLSVGGSSSRFSLPSGHTARIRIKVRRRRKARLRLRAIAHDGLGTAKTTKARVLLV